MINIEHRTSNIQRPTSNVESLAQRGRLRRVSLSSFLEKGKNSIFDVQCSMFDVGRSFFVVNQLGGKSTLKPDDPFFQTKVWYPLSQNRLIYKLSMQPHFHCLQ